MPFEIRQVDGSWFNKWLVARHYLHRPVIRSKLLAHGVYCAGNLVGGLLWATPHFTRKRGLFGMPGTSLDKWEVLMLARFYLRPGAGLIASQVLAESVGKGKGRGSKRRGYRVQEDWVRTHKPRYPDNPYVPRLLISWSDHALETVEDCWCGELHEGQHEGTIYKASGWELWDVTKSEGQRTTGEHNDEGEKFCWIMRLGPNLRAEKLGQTGQLAFVI